MFEIVLSMKVYFVTIQDVGIVNIGHVGPENTTSRLTCRVLGSSSHRRTIRNSVHHQTPTSQVPKEKQTAPNNMVHGPKCDYSAYARRLRWQQTQTTPSPVHPVRSWHERAQHRRIAFMFVCSLTPPFALVLTWAGRNTYNNISSNDY